MAALKRGGRAAHTSWRVERRFRHFTLLRVFPKTGKTHQIRVHLAHIGLPIAVDPLYNGSPEAVFLSQIKRDYRAKRGEQERALIARLALHAEAIEFVHPDGTVHSHRADLPKDFRAALNMLTKYDRP
jgi:23S rRNA pseudouridine955/2504/2580 synthase/23S rRNA pseudouridine1911/1915/1917 synthase